MARVVVDVMPKPEILDPQGKAVPGRCPGSASTASPTSGRASASSSRSTARSTDETLRRDRQMAETLLSNPVIEDFTVTGRGAAAAGRGVMRVGVVTFPGSLDDVDAARAVRLAGAEPVALWHGDHDLQRRRRGRAAGRLLLRRLPALRRDRRASRRSWPRSSRPPDAACRCSASATASRSSARSHLLPGALIRNDRPQFVCRDQRLRVENDRDRVDRGVRRGRRRSSSR